MLNTILFTFLKLMIIIDFDMQIPNVFLMSKKW